MYSKMWIISDTHFWYDSPHGAVLIDCGRPKDFHEKTMRHWKRMIGDNDLVYHLGDVFFGKRGQMKDIITSLPGYKVLIKGNHDRNHTEWYMENGFTAVVDQLTLVAKMRVGRNNMARTRIILSHKPVAIPEYDEKDNRRTINIHGHFHNNPIEQCEPSLTDLLTDDHYLFSLEHTGYKPVLLQNAVHQGLVREGE